jgi:CheY-like chemotaxis protein
VEMNRLDHHFTVAVSDSGKGFGTPVSTLSAFSGKFGLFNVQERLEALGGRFAIESYPGRGSRVSFELLLPQGIDAPEEKVRGGSGQAPPEATRHIGVLVVDDHKLVREGLRRMINKFENMNVVGEAADGEQAVELAKSLRPDAIIMDINMPRMNGLEATRLIKNDMPAVTVIGHSVHDDEDVVDSLREAGITNYIMKGGSAQELYRALSAAGGVQPPAMHI